MANTDRFKNGYTAYMPVIELLQRGERYPHYRFTTMCYRALVDAQYRSASQAITAQRKKQQFRAVKVLCQRTMKTVWQMYADEKTPDGYRWNYDDGALLSCTCNGFDRKFGAKPFLHYPDCGLALYEAGYAIQSAESRPWDPDDSVISGLSPWLNDAINRDLNTLGRQLLRYAAEAYAAYRVNQYPANRGEYEEYKRFRSSQ